MLDEQAIQRACEEALKSYLPDRGPGFHPWKLNTRDFAMFRAGAAYGLRRAGSQYFDWLYDGDMRSFQQFCDDEAARVEGVAN